MAPQLINCTFGVFKSILTAATAIGKLPLLGPLPTGPIQLGAVAMQPVNLLVLQQPTLLLLVLWLAACLPLVAAEP